MTAPRTSKTSRISWKTLAHVLLWVALMGLAVSNILLLRQNRDMRAKLGNEKPNFVKPGDKMATFDAAGLRGEQFSVRYTGNERQRVFFFFAPA